MTGNSRKGIGLAIIGSIILILVAVVVLSEENREPSISMEKMIVVEVEPVVISSEIEMEHELRDTLVLFAQQFMDVPYKYASCNPEDGFDCSGFVYYVFREFGIECPRSSKFFLEAGEAVELNELKKGDVLVFTGTNPNKRVGGHVGIVLSEIEPISFIHSSSGSANGVTISSLDEPNYKRRFLGARNFISY